MSRECWDLSRSVGTSPVSVSESRPYPGPTTNMPVPRLSSLLLRFVTFLWFPEVNSHTADPRCTVRSPLTGRNYREGDFILGGVLGLKAKLNLKISNFEVEPTLEPCDM
ncbi:hypothetical protein NDU88_011689 [Pleurodeles waltl]|uniref:Uncharacterized protein n=1 Tax=Pleurodeles waltl TaxID=8319 RepID=A0AAV7S667_PLEWA|nr:hypothetical protein NDU88_011689 [Pleurodeles waltl]